MGVKLVSSSGGSVELVAPTTASNYTMTVPANSGTVLTTASTFAGTGPAFSATIGTGGQTTSAGTFTKITCNTEIFDTNNCYDNLSNYRFTPNVPGYYQVNLRCYNGNTTPILVSIYKNGSSVAQGSVLQPSSANGTSGATTFSLLYMNGSTDYVEAYVLAVGGSSSIFAASLYTEFSGALVRAA